MKEGNKMKYYGLRRKRFNEELIYTYAKQRAQILRKIPGNQKKFWSNNYNLVYGKNSFVKYMAEKHSNEIPKDGKMELNQVIICDLVRREDIKSLQAGVRHLIKHKRANRFLGGNIDGLDKICRQIETMDSTLLSWYNKVECGIFEFKRYSLEKEVDYFILNIWNVNSAFLAVELIVYLTEEKKKELQEIIYRNYIDEKGYAFSTLTGKSGKNGAYENYSVVHYNNASLKADRIYEMVSCFEWKILDKLSSNIPFLLHGQGIMPPRMEMFYTNIDYREGNNEFWDSIGIREYNGEFIDDRQKIFFEAELSDRYEKAELNNRMLYVIKDDYIEIGQLQSVKDEVYFHIKEYSIEYFKIMFLRILAREAGKQLVVYRRKLDNIKLKRNQLNQLLKLKYDLSKNIDDYNKFIRDEIWEKTDKRLQEIFEENAEIASKAKHKFFISMKSYIQYSVNDKKKIDKDIDILYREYDDKKEILQNLADFKNNKRSLWLNLAMLFVSAVTLSFVVFPKQAEALAKVIREIYNWILQLIP